MVRQAKAMVADGQLGTIRLVQVEYVQGGKADESKSDPSTSWRFDPVRGGPSLVMGDIGSHAHNLVRFITGLEIAEVGAEIGNIVPGRAVHDYGGPLFPFGKRGRGTSWVKAARGGVARLPRVFVAGPQRPVVTALAS